MTTLTFPFIVSVISAAVSGIFAGIVLKSWLEKRRPHLLAWGIGLALYTLGSFSQVVLALVWSPIFFGLWYWSGALVTAPWLGQGTAYLLIRRGNIARNLNMALVLVSLMTLPWTLFLTPMNGAAWHPGADITQIYREVKDANGTVTQPGIMPASSAGTVRVFAPIMNIWGTLLLVGGAIYSAWLFRRKNIMRNRVVGNWLIAAGGLFPAFAGALVSLGNPAYQYIGVMIGAILIFAGYWLATNVPEDARLPSHRTSLTGAPAAAGDSEAASEQAKG
jgi:hypothetical protein